jgi:glycosyltransferase involved in cell wall biosynthesis
VRPPRATARDRRNGPLHVVAYCDVRRPAGAERSLATLIAALDDRVEITVMGIDEETVAMLAAGRPGARRVIVRPLTSFRDLAGWAEHLSVLRRLRPDVFQANLPGPWLAQYPLIAAALTPGVKPVAFVHLVLRARRRRRQWLSRFVLSRMAATVTVGERSARELEQIARLPGGSVRAIHNGVPEMELGPVARPTAPTVGSLGRLETQKGYDELLRAIGGRPDVRVVLVGDGSERARLEALASDLGLADRLAITGWLEDARRQLANFDIFVLPSRFEAFPLAIIEAMLASLPVIATDVGSVAEAVTHEQTGLLVAPGDADALAQAIGRLLDDPAERTRMGACGREIAMARFTPEAMASSFQRLYEEITA